MAKYGYDYRGAGLLIFDGIQLDGKKIASFYRTESNGRKGVTFTFADGNVYTFDCVENSGIFTDIKEYWNGVLINGRGV